MIIKDHDVGKWTAEGLMRSQRRELDSSLRTATWCLAVWHWAVFLSAEWAFGTRCFQNSFLVLTLLEILSVYKFVEERWYLFCIILHFSPLPVGLKRWPSSPASETPASLTPPAVSPHPRLGDGSSSPLALRGRSCRLREGNKFKYKQ